MAFVLLQAVLFKVIAATHSIAAEDSAFGQLAFNNTDIDRLDAEP